MYSPLASDPSGLQPVLPPSPGPAATQPWWKFGRGNTKEVATTPTTETVEEDPIPTVAFAIPFPEAPGASAENRAKAPPFVLYSPAEAHFEAPEEGEKESMVRMAQRKWQETQREAKEALKKEATGEKIAVKDKAMGYVGKAVDATKNSRIEFLNRAPATSKIKELRVIYPASFPVEDIQEKFTTMLKTTKSAAIRNGVIATALLPFVFVIDTVTFLPGPFEISAIWCAASWRGASRASSMSNAVSNATIRSKFTPTPLLDSFAFRLHEHCWELVQDRAVIGPPSWTSDQPLMTGVELAALCLAIVTQECGLGAADGLERNLELMHDDLESVLRKGAEEWASSIGYAVPRSADEDPLINDEGLNSKDKDPAL
ncbi:hypothetical protein BT69DRAFT_1325530 [Atractiella rhizophila]|nr:hypothetical protein BT69DRAFT_1325530 [Atractiella rhizophila]